MTALPEQLTEDTAVVRAVSALERAGLSEREREIYEGEVQKQMVDAIQLRTAKQEGVQEGVQLGKQERRLSLLLRQMTHRFGAVPASIAPRLQASNADVLDDLAVALFDFASYADVEQWLARN